MAFEISPSGSNGSIAPSSEADHKPGGARRAAPAQSCDLRRNDPKFQEPRFSQYLSPVASLDRYARERYGLPVLALAVRWVLDQGETVALWGARRPAQLDPVDDAMGWELDDQAKKRIDAILVETLKDPVGPEFMAPPSQDDSALAA